MELEIACRSAIPRLRDPTRESAFSTNSTLRGPFSYAGFLDASNHLKSRGSSNARLKLSTFKSIALLYFSFLISQVSRVKNAHIHHSSASTGSSESSTSPGDHLLSNLWGRGDKVRLLLYRAQAHFVQLPSIQSYNVVHKSCTRCILKSC